jgi:predicted nucleic acid-binding protein
VAERAAHRISSELAELNHLDARETAAIALAPEIHADAIVSDERRRHAVAARVGLVVIGLLRVLLQGKNGGINSGDWPCAESASRGRRVLDFRFSPTGNPSPGRRKS